jgi:hypothetical protein
MTNDLERMIYNYHDYKLSEKIAISPQLINALLVERTELYNQLNNLSDAHDELLNEIDRLKQAVDPRRL